MFVESLACLFLATPVPQTPPTAPAETTPVPSAMSETGIVTAAAVLPGDSVLAVGLRQSREHASGFAGTQLGRELDALLSGQLATRLSTAAASWLEERADLELQSLLDCVAAGGGAAVRIGATGQPEWLIALRVPGDDAALETGLARLAERAGEGPHPIALPWLEGERIFATVASRWLLVGSTEALTADARLRALAATEGTAPAAESLANTSGYLAACDHALLASRRPPYLTVWCDVQRGITAGLAAAPAELTKQAGPWLSALGLDSLEHLTVTVDAEAGKVEERLLIGMPAPRSPLIDALAPTGDRPLAERAKLAPPVADSFAITSLDLPRAWQALRTVLAERQPETADQLREMVAGLREQIGIDLEQDLLQHLGSQLVTTGWRNAQDQSVQAVVLTSPRPDRLEGALRGLVTHEPSRQPGFTVFRARSGLPFPSFAVGKVGLIFASDDGALDYWLSTQRGAMPHPRAEELLSDLPTQATGMAWSENAGSSLADALEFAPDNLPNGTAMPAEARALFDELRSQLRSMGELTQHVLADDRGYTVQLGSASGTFSFATLAIASSAVRALNDSQVVDGLLGDARAQQLLTAQRLAGVLARLRSSGIEFHSTHGHFPTLDELLAAPDGAPLRTLLGEARSRDIYEFDDHLVGSLRDERAGHGTEASEHFVLLAWPDRAERGVVVMTTELLAPHRNDLLAQHDGLTDTSLHEVFVGGEVGAPLTPGWRPIEEIPELVSGTSEPATGSTLAGTTSTNTESGNPAADGTLRAVVLALEAEGADAAPRLAEHLDANDQELLARIVWRLGEFRYAPAAPRLVELATTHTDTAVRVQALAALRKLGAAGGAPARDAAATLLESDADPQVRAQAASLLGRLADPQAKDLLMAFLVAEATPAPGVETAPTTNRRPGKDRAAAILALADLGAVDELGAIATATPQPNTTESQALAFAWQTLSPRMPAEEEVVALVSVLDHRSALLRRYAIQRLGELEDSRALTALENRLANESDELRPLVEVSLAAVRGALPANDPQAATNANEDGPLEQLQTALEDPDTQLAAGGGFVALVLGGLLVTWQLRRRRRRRDAEEWASMVDPSDEFADEAGGEDIAWELDDGGDDYAEDIPFDAVEAGYDTDDTFAPQSSAEGDEDFGWPMEDESGEFEDDIATDASWEDSQR